jgi:hypothetical protein
MVVGGAEMMLDSVQLHEEAMLRSSSGRSDDRGAAARRRCLLLRSCH